MGQNNSIVQTSSKYKVDYGILQYMSQMTDDNVCAIEKLETDMGDGTIICSYIHLFPSDNFNETMEKYEAGENTSRRYYYVPSASGNYCVFTEVGTNVGTNVGKDRKYHVVDLNDCARVVEIIDLDDIDEIIDEAYDALLEK
jgi:hypothetical protein